LPLTGANYEALETPESMRHVVSELRVHRIILAPATLDTGEVAHLIRVAKAVGVRVSVLPRMFEVVGASVEFEAAGQSTALLWKSPNGPTKQLQLMARGAGQNMRLPARKPHWSLKLASPWCSSGRIDLPLAQNGAANLNA